MPLLFFLPASSLLTCVQFILFFMPKLPTLTDKRRIGLRRAENRQNIQFHIVKQSLNVAAIKVLLLKSEKGFDDQWNYIKQGLQRMRMP